MSCEQPGLPLELSDHIKFYNFVDLNLSESVTNSGDRRLALMR